MPRQIHSGSNPSVSDELFEEMAGLADDDTAEIERDMATEDIFDTAHSDGHTYNPEIAMEQGLVYTPPTDEPVRPSDDPQGVEIAAGFAPSMEATDPDEEDLPPRVDNNDLELQDDVYLALRNNSETMNLDDVTVRVDDGVVTLLGTVQTEDDIALASSIVTELEGVDEVRNKLTLAI